MAAIITELLTGLTAIWTFVTSTFVPADAASVNIVHFALWGGVLLSFAMGFLGMLRSARRR